MAFSPEQLPSGKWRGGFRHPVTRKKIRSKPFATPDDARQWAIHAEAKALREVRHNDASRLGEVLRETAVLAAFALHAGDDEGARSLAADVVQLHARWIQTFTAEA